MAYTNSSLVSYKKLSPNHSGKRNHTIDTISIHCTVGQVSVETLGNVFATTSRQASCNYGIGSDGRIGLYVEEKNRSWCTSSASNDHRAITIEVASDSTHPYKVNDKAFNSLINLLVDICKRNNIKKLLWKGDKSLIGQVDKQNMTVHRWFANKSCPGDYLYNLHGDIASKVNARLSSASSSSSTSTSSEKTYYRVVCGSYTVKSNADKMLKELTSKGYKPFIAEFTKDNKKYYRVVCGSFSVKSNADNMVTELKGKGYKPFIDVYKK